jgi:hypothetical protein
MGQSAYGGTPYGGFKSSTPTMDYGAPGGNMPNPAYPPSVSPASPPSPSFDPAATNYAPQPIPQYPGFNGAYQDLGNGMGTRQLGPSFVPPGAFDPVSTNGMQMGMPDYKSGIPSKPALSAVAQQQQNPSFVWDGQKGTQPNWQGMGFDPNTQAGLGAMRHFRYWAQNPMGNQANQQSMQQALSQEYANLPPSAFKR